MSAVAIAPTAKAFDCGWCGLRKGTHTVYATATCTECKNGGRAFRVRMAQQRLKRAAGE